MDLLFSIGLGVFGGLALFLYGMQIMSKSLQKVAGRRLEHIIGVLTTNRFFGVLVGAFVTAVVQSSSATTVMVVGFVNAGVMQLTQAVGVILGANIGTTITGQIVSLSLNELAPLAVGIGVFSWLLTHNNRTKNIAEILIGFGILFIGMSFLKDALSPLREWPYFKTIILSLSHNPFLGVIIGFMLTFLVQSSSASISILIALAASGALPLSAALPILYGDNIGTCTTALISSIGASRNAKRAAVIHLTFNIIGTVIFVVFLSGPISQIARQLSPLHVERQIANVHTMFNIINVIIQFPFAFLLVKFAIKVIPLRDDEGVVKMTKYIDDRLLETPSLAIDNAKKEVVNMGKLANDSFSFAMQGLLEKDIVKIEKTFESERAINKYQRILIEYSVKMTNRNISAADREYIDGLFSCIHDIERIGDHADNIAELAMTIIENKIDFSDYSVDSLRAMYDKTKLSLDLALASLASASVTDVDRVIKLEAEMDELQKVARKQHFARLHDNICTSEAGIYYLEIINNLERISDLSHNLARFVIAHMW